MKINKDPIDLIAELLKDFPNALLYSLDGKYEHPKLKWPGYAAIVVNEEIIAYVYKFPDWNTSELDTNEQRIHAWILEQFNTMYLDKV